MVDVKEVALKAEVIIEGFAVLWDGDYVKVINLNNAEGVAVFKPDGTLIETNMDPVELSIARQNMLGSLSYMGD